MSQKYFNKLNYTLANEDTSLELELLPEATGHVLSVAGSGGRITPLLAKSPQKVTCVDLVQEQLYLTELRIETIRSLSHSDFMAFWGYPPRSMSGNERKAAFYSLSLSPNAQKSLEKIFKEKNWGSILYDGKWERTFKKLSKLNNSLTGIKGLKIFECLNLDEQKEYLAKHFPKKAWKAVLMLLGNAAVFNALLYKGHFPKKNINESFFDLYSKAFGHLFNTGLARQNFFLQLVFFGQVMFREGCPIECDSQVFQKAKQALHKTEITYKQGDLISVAKSSETPIDFVSLSDVPSYFSGELERTFLKQIQPRVAPGGMVVLRNYLHIPEHMDVSGYTDVTNLFQAAIQKEKIQVYNVALYRNGVAH